MTLVTKTTRLIESDTGDYPVYLSELSSRVKTTIFPSSIDSDELIAYGYEVVHDVAVPEADVVVEGKPVLTDGEWYRTYVARSFTEDEVASNLAQAKALLEPQIEAFRVAQFEKGFPYQFAEGLYHVQIRTTDRQNISSIRVIAKEAIAESRDMEIKFRVFENVNVTLTAAEFVALADTTFARVTEGYGTAWVLKDQVKAATTLAELPTIPDELFTPVETFSL
ncbi:hypothetical protein [Pseudomonas phage D6]|nr:hypothetical protein [Pseudomonas phage D6]